MTRVTNVGDEDECAGQSQRDDAVQWQDDSENVRKLATFDSPRHWLNEEDTPIRYGKFLSQEEKKAATQCLSDRYDAKKSIIARNHTPRQSSRSFGGGFSAQKKTLGTLYESGPIKYKSCKRQRREASLRNSANKEQKATPTLTNSSASASVLQEGGSPDSASSASAPVDYSVDFRDLLREVQTQSPSANKSSITLSSKDQTSIKQEATNSTNIALTPEQVSSMPLSESSVINNVNDEFGGLDLSPEDLELLDTMAVNATKVSKDEVEMSNLDPVQPMKSEPVVSRDPPTMKSEVCVPTRSNIPKNDEFDDPFGELLDVDFDEMDDMVSNAALHLLTKDLPEPPPPMAPVHNRRVELPSPSPAKTYLSFSRYQVTAVHINTSTFTKTLSVATWHTDMTQQDADSKALHRTDENGFVRISEPRKWPVAGYLYLRGEWYHTPIEQGDVVHVCSLSGQFRTDPKALPLVLHTAPPSGSDGDDLVLVVHPDLLLTPTAISETVTCNRRSVLKQRLGSSGLTAEASLFGTMRHELLEEALRQKDFSIDTIMETAAGLIREHAPALLACGASSSKAETELLKFIPQMQQFAAEYTELDRQDKEMPKGAVLLDHCNRPTVTFLAKAVEGIEEPAISPELGLKGNVDMILNVLTTGLSSPPRMSLFGVELKTGHMQKTQRAHLAQLLLYILMMQTRHGVEVSAKKSNKYCSHQGILLYMNNESIRTVHIIPMIAELKSLIGQRNMVAVDQTRTKRPRGVSLVANNDEPQKVAA